MTAWVTNSPEAARTLRKIDAMEARAKIAASNLPLAEKIKRFREIKAEKEAAIAAFREEWK